MLKRSLLVVLLLGCKQSPPVKIDEASRPLAGKTGVVGLEAMRAYAQLTDADKEALRKKRVFFGHQSVGKNLIDGARAIGFPFTKAEDSAAFAAVTWGDAPVDRNGDPLRKIASFKRYVADQKIGGAVDVASFKFCWIDFESGTDVPGLLAKYDAEVSALAAANPKLKIVHVTPPLTTNDPGANEVRWRFGRALVEKYRGQGIVFDLAEVVATQNDGTLCDKRGTPRMCDEWASDEGHLNGPGSERAAKAFVVAVSRVLS